MLPSVVATQLRQTIEEYLRTTFSLKDERYEAALLEFLRHPEHGLFRGPYLDIRLPFRQADGDGPPPLTVRPDFTPYAHQQRSWDRLSSRTNPVPRSTLVATGTGSGKTECFLYPLLDHCLRHQGTPGVKAIVLYPMNALASDQAERFAKEIHNWTPTGSDQPGLRGKVTAGLYIGGEGTVSKPEEKSLVDVKKRLRENPPDILLTNYRMLDFLLMRPDDRDLWVHNEHCKLQYLVLDELHTYDGAQGTDVAFLIRRLKQRLGVASGRLCCVGTSATIGGTGDAGRRALLNFAGDVFDEQFDEDAIVVEDRLTVAETFTSPPADEVTEPENVAPSVLDPNAYDSSTAYLEAQAGVWLGPPPTADRDAWFPNGLDTEARENLGAALDTHPFLRDLLRAITRGGSGGPGHWDDDIVAALPEDNDVRGITDPDHRWALLASFVSLVSASKRPDGSLTVQLQLWMRELRRLLRKVPRHIDDVPSFKWWDEGLTQYGSKVQYATQVYCRECGEAGFGMLKLEGRDDLVCAPEKVGEGFLRRATTARFVQLGDRLPPGQQEMSDPHHLCPATLNLSHRPEPNVHDFDAEGTLVPIARIRVTQHGPDRTLETPRFTGQCPQCQADDGLTILGSRAASLSSVAVSHLFQSGYNNDPKLLAFTDSVQDASHRAGFFGGRAFRFTLRTAIQTVIQRAPEDLPLDALAAEVLRFWKQELGGADAPLGRAAATLLPPDLRDDPAYRDFIESLEAGKTPGKKARLALDALVAERLAWEVTREFGLAVFVGRSLDKTGCSTAYPPEDALSAASAKLARWINEQRPIQRAGADLEDQQARHFLRGIVERLRTRGGVHNPLLAGYVAEGNRFFLSRRKAPRLSRFGQRSVLPRFGYHGAIHKVFEPVLGPPRRVTWFRDWAARSLGAQTKDEGIAPVVERALELLAEAEIVDTRATKGLAGNTPQVSGLRPQAMFVTRNVSSVACPDCGTSKTVPTSDLPRWIGETCTTYRCEGRWTTHTPGERARATHDYYRRVYTSGGVRRVFADEHTGLLNREKRENVERAFKRGEMPDAPNLLACTPTLEMGIDIGDLSAVMLCSVPPLPANYIQRVGRAGRSTGNALVLTIANARPHDRYFFEVPEQMMRGHVDPPSCFLDAPDMLRRQLVAHALDHWARGTKELRIVRKMQDLLGPANKEGFPTSFYRYYESNKFVIAGSFFHTFGFEGSLTAARNAVKDEMSALFDTNFPVTAIRRAIDEFKEERSALIKRRKALVARKAAVQADPTLATPHEEDPDKSAEHELADLEDAIGGYGRQILDMSGKYPPSVLTDAGVLPNYAFPEPGVTLRATFLGTPQGAQAKTAKPAKAKYNRPASAALREFAPFNSFYAEGRKIRITQLDLGTKKQPTIELWRLCPACDHAAPEDPTAPPPTACPSCKGQGWCDSGQLRNMISFRKAWSSTTISEASTADDTDDREQERYATKQLIERVDGEAMQHARYMEADAVVFGYELWERANLREINFGRVWDTGIDAMVAGDRINQHGFGLCRHCGRVQDPSRPTPDHAAWCRVRVSGAAPVFDEVCLYREMSSEAIRVLLPVANHEVAEVRLSVAAALELGFRKKFGGQPAHLKISTMSEPAPEGRKHFLVIYDTVPGGTGYLAELWRSGEFFAVMRLALDAMRECVCARAEEQRDGCYRCVFAHQHQQDLASISRYRASEIFAKVLDVLKKTPDALTRVPSLSEVRPDSLLESELERQFVSVLRAQAELRSWTVQDAVYKGANAWRIKVNDTLTWEVRPQVMLGSSDGVEPTCKPDFVLAAVGRADLRKIAVFVDGFGFHAQPDASRSRIQDDILKRDAILNASPEFGDSGRHWVFSLTYTDVQLAAGAERSVPLDGKLKLLGVSGAARRRFATIDGVADADAADPDLTNLESFALLLRWLEDPCAKRWQRTAVAAALCMADLKHPVSSAVEAEFTQLEHAALHSLPTEFSTPSQKDGGLVVGLKRSPHGLLATQCKISDLGDRNPGRVVGVLRLDDGHAARQSPDFEPSWRSFWQAWNLLQFHDLGVDVVSTERLLDLGGARPPKRATQEIAAVVSDTPAFPKAYANLDVSFASAMALWNILDGAGIEAPIELAESDLPIADSADFDLFWPPRGVAVQLGCDEHDQKAALKQGWRVFDYETADPQAILDALKAEVGR